MELSKTVGFNYPENSGEQPFKEMPKNTYELPIEQAVYVPSKDKFGHKLPSKLVKREVEDTKQKLTDWFGGESAVKVAGRYKKENGEIIKEPVVKVTSFATKEDYAKYNIALEKWLSNKPKEMNQDSIGYEFEGKMYYLKE
jgi:hypothetical protein